MAVSNDEFRAALSRFPSGVTVVTTRDAAGSFHGITVSAFSSLSLDPPLVLVCIEKSAGSHDAFLESGSFVVNILNSLQSDVSEHFASHIPDKFAGMPLRSGTYDIPMIEGSVANLECRLKQSCDGGDHTIFVGEVENVSLADGDPLVYFRSGYGTVAERQ